MIAEDLLASLDYGFTDSGFSNYLQAFQRSVVLRLDELRAMVPALQWVLLERIAVLAKHALGHALRKDTNGPRVTEGRTSAGH